MASVNPPAQWVTDQTLSPDAPVDIVVQAENSAALLLMVPFTTLGTGADEPAADTTSGGGGTDTVKATKTKSAK